MKAGDVIEIKCHYGDEVPDWARGGNFSAYARVIQLGDPAVVEVLRTGKRETIPRSWLHPAWTST